MKLKITDTVYNLGLTEEVIKIVHINDFDTGAGITSKITAKGSLLAGTGVGALGEISVGTDGQFLTADSAESTGLKWVSSSSQGGVTLGVTLTNKSGTTVYAGSPVVLYKATAQCFTTTTTESDRLIFGVTAEDIADNASGNVLVAGAVGTIRVTGTVAIGDGLASSTTAGRAIANKYNAFAHALTANPSGTGTVTAVIGNPTIPNVATMWGDEVITSVTITRNAVSTTYSYCYLMYAAAANAADGDEYTWRFNLSAGSYTINLLGGVNTNAGKLDAYVDDVLVGSGQDWYAAGAAALKSFSSCIVPYSGNHVLKLKVNGKNASSADYCVRLTKIWFTPS